MVAVHDGGPGDRRRMLLGEHDDRRFGVKLDTASCRTRSQEVQAPKLTCADDEESNVKQDGVLLQSWTQWKTWKRRRGG